MRERRRRRWRQGKRIARLALYIYREFATPGSSVFSSFSRLTLPRFRRVFWLRPRRVRLRDMTAKGLPVLLIALSMLMLLGCVQGEINQRTSAQSLEPDTEPATVTQTTYSTSMENWRKDCSRSYSSACLKLDVVSFVDRLSEQDDLGMELFMFFDCVKNCTFVLRKDF